MRCDFWQRRTFPLLQVRGRLQRGPLLSQPQPSGSRASPSVVFLCKARVTAAHPSVPGTRGHLAPWLPRGSTQVTPQCMGRPRHHPHPPPPPPASSCDPDRGSGGAARAPIACHSMEPVVQLSQITTDPRRKGWQSYLIRTQTIACLLSNWLQTKQAIDIQLWDCIPSALCPAVAQRLREAFNC